MGTFLLCVVSIEKSFLIILHFNFDLLLGFNLSRILFVAGLIAMLFKIILHGRMEGDNLRIQT